MSGPDSPAADAARVWRDFCSEAGQGGATAAGAVGLPDPADQADGALQLGTLLAAALRWELGAGYADFPRFVEINDTPELADNVFAPVRGGAIYRLTGWVESLFDFNISIHTNWGWMGPSRVSGDLGRSDLAIDGEGRLELFLSATPVENAANWHLLPADAAFIQIREYHPDYACRRPGAFRLERLDGAAAPERPSPADLAAHLERAAAWMGNYVQFHLAAQERLFPRESNALRPPVPVPGGNSHIWYGFGRFALEPGQALVISFDRPEARVWGIQWQKAGWFENADLHNRFTSLPGGEAAVDPDGRVRIVICAVDCRAPNWLETAGFHQGLILARWIWCEASPAIELEVVPIDQVGSVLHPATQLVTPRERAVQLERRKSHFAHRRR